ncbi:MAG: Gfo/Idh/MocA family oxidoreductase [Acidobacteria bacterium]|nr:Gfo/Idh/MocA family oxidoreductase [Acidobacteriota bacterium]
MGIKHYVLVLFYPFPRCSGILGQAPSAEEMFSAGALDAVSVCTPPSDHLATARVAFKRHVSVLCEKPAALSLHQAELIYDSLRASAGVFQMATKFRHVPEIQEARRLIREGEIGQPLRLQIEFAGVADMSSRWNSDPSRSGGGVIIDNGSHALDLGVYLLGAIDRVTASRIQTSVNLAVEDAATIDLAFASGAAGEITVSWSHAPVAPFYLNVAGISGSIAIGWKASFFQRQGGEPVQIGNGYSKDGAHKAMMAHFRDLVHGNAGDWITRQEVLANAAAIDAAYHSLRSGQPVSVEEVHRAAVAA